MASEIRVDKINSLSGVGTVTLSPTGVDIAGITTVATFKVGTGITASSDGDVFATGVCTATKFVGANAEVSGDLSGATGTFTGNVSIADKIIHTGDTNTAIRFPAADTISLETAGTEASRIDSSGNFMVGTTSAAGKVSVQGAAGGVALQTTDATNSTFRISHPSSGVNLLAGGSSQHLALGTGFAEKLRIDSGGRTLIGTTTQNNNAKLQVTTDQQVVATFEGTGSSDPQIYLGDDMSSPTNNCVIMGYDKADNRGYLTIGGDADTSLTINDGSLIGVNTNVPVEHFGVAGNIRLVNPTGTTRRINAIPSGSYTLGSSGGSAIAFTRFSDAGGGSDEIIFETHFQGTQHEEAARFDKYGNLKFPNGHGIDFSSKAGSNGGATSSILDDYEEGTYTIADASGNGLTYTANTTTRYVKVGQSVYVQFDVTTTNANNATTQNSRFNLPFAVGHDYGSGVVGWNDSNRQVMLHISSAGAYFMDMDTSNDGTSHLNNTQIGNKRFIGSFWYLAAT